MTHEAIVSDTFSELMSAQSGRMVLEFDSYRVSVQLGSSHRLILSVSGFDHVAGEFQETAMLREWKGTLDRLKTDDHVIYLQDSRNAWFNGERGWSDLIDFIKQYKKACNITESIALGLSMGGTGALILDQFLEFDRVVALVPQTLVGHDVCAWDSRYQEAWRNIPDIRFPRIADCLRDDGQYVLLFAVDVVEDARHVAALLTAGMNVEAFLSRAGEHNITFEMRRRGEQEDVLAALLSTDDVVDLSPFGYQRVDADFMASGDMILEEGLDQCSPADVHRLGMKYPSQVPTSFYPALREFEIDRVLSAGGNYRDAAGTMFPIHASQICKPEELKNYAVFGWNALDYGFTWSEGAHHFIRFSVIDFKTHEEVTAKLFFLPLLHVDHKSQRIVISLNGEIVHQGVVEYGTHEASMVEVTVALKSADCEFYIYTPDFVSPSALGIGQDTRRMAVSLNKLELASA